MVAQSHPRVITGTTWRGDEPNEQTITGGPGGDLHRTFSSRRGHLAQIAGRPDVAFTYDDAGNLARVHVEGVADVEVSSCDR